MSFSKTQRIIITSFAKLFTAETHDRDAEAALALSAQPVAFDVGEARAQVLHLAAQDALASAVDYRHPDFYNFEKAKAPNIKQLPALCDYLC